MFKSILKNSSYLLFAQVLTKIVAFFYSSLFLPKLLGVENFGLYIVALSYFSFISAVSDFGMSRYLIREVSRSRENIENSISNVFLLRMTLLSVVYALAAFLILLYDPSHIRANLTILAIAAVVPQGIALTIDNVFIALSKFFYSSLGIIFLSLSTALFGVYFVGLGLGTFGAILAIIAGELLYAGFLVVIFFRKKIQFRGIVSNTFVKTVLSNSLPYGIIGILGLIFFKIDSVILSYMKGSFETGVYGAAYKFIEAATFIPATVGTVLFPTLARIHEDDKEQVRKITKNIFLVMGGIGILLAIGFIIVLPILVKLVLPKFVLSIEPIKILSLTIPFMFVHVTLSQVLLSSDKYLKPVVAISFLTVFANVALNLALIPNYGYIGASWVTVFSDILSLGLLLGVFKKYIFA